MTNSFIVRYYIMICLIMFSGLKSPTQLVVRGWLVLQLCQTNREIIKSINVIIYSPVL